MFDWMRLKRTYIAFDKKINIYSFSSCIPFILSLAPIARKLILLITFYTLLQLCNIFNVACFCGWLSRIVFSCVVLSLRIVACLWDYSDFYVVADFHVSQSLLSLPHPFYSVPRRIRHKDITIFLLMLDSCHFNSVRCVLNNEMGFNATYMKHQFKWNLPIN